MGSNRSQLNPPGRSRRASHSAPLRSRSGRARVARTASAPRQRSRPIVGRSVASATRSLPTDRDDCTSFRVGINKITQKEQFLLVWIGSGGRGTLDGDRPEHNNLVIFQAGLFRARAFPPSIGQFHSAVFFYDSLNLVLFNVKRARCRSGFYYGCFQISSSV